MTPAAIRFTVAREWKQLRDESRDLGPIAGLQLLATRLFGTARLHRLVIPGFRFPVYHRPGTSDVLVLRQVLGQHEYACVGSESNVRTILDLGGNIGAAAYFLLQRYPKVRLVFVEPDTGNMAVARRTLAPFRHRVAFVPSGIWDASVPLTIDRSGYRDGGEWAYRVRPTRPGEVADLVGVTIDDLLMQRGWAKVDLVKMDIEGAEAVVFRGTTAAMWLPNVGTLAVELHGPDCEAALTSAYETIPHTRSLQRETTVVRLKPETR